MGETASWEGKWETNWGTMQIVEHEDGRLTGRYGAEQHSIEGKIDSDNAAVFAGIWTHSNSDLTGRFRFVMSARNSFAGAWSFGDDHPSEVGYPWTATRGLIVEVQPCDQRL